MRICGNLHSYACEWNLRSPVHMQQKISPEKLMSDLTATCEHPLIVLITWGGGAFVFLLLQHRLFVFAQIYDMIHVTIISDESLIPSSMVTGEVTSQRSGPAR